MSLLKHISQFNLSANNFQSLSPKDIIKIEKKLRAEVKFNEEININDVELIITAIKNNPLELKTFFLGYFNYLRDIITNPKEIIVFHNLNNQENVPKVWIELTEFISVSFKKELESYINKCIKENHYYGLFSLLNYKDFLNDYLLDLIIVNLKKKLVFSFEFLKVNKKDSFYKVEYIANPYFFRCLSKLNPLNFENEVIDIVNLCNKVYFLQNENKFFLRFFFSLSYFKSSRSDLNEIIEKLSALSLKKGVKERYYNENEKNQKGNTYFENAQYLVQPNSTAYSSKNKRLSNSKGISNEVYLILGIVVFLIFIFIKISHKSRNVSINYNNNNFHNIPHVNPHVNPQNQTKNTDGYIFFKELIDKIEYYQLGNYTLYGEKAISFNINNTYFKDYKYSNNNLDIQDTINIINTYILDVIVLLNINNEKFVEFIPPLDTLKVFQKIHGISLYTGMNPVNITFENALGEIKEGFKFITWGEKEREELNNYYHLKQNDSLNIFIINTEFGYDVKQIDRISTKNKKDKVEEMIQKQFDRMLRPVSN